MGRIKESIYTCFIKENMPRVLTQIDRDKNSRTYGSCDRNYWHLKIRDFSSAILQQSCLTLAIAYNVKFEGNIYFRNENVKEWAIAALRYLEKIQLRDGSFNEYYPNEHGFPPTAFCLFAACRTYQELNLDNQDILNMMHRTAKWLMKHHEKNAYNQEIASVAGLYYFYMISKENTILMSVNEKVDSILKVQSSEGWFPEQGGADIGYSSVALDMLMEYYFASRDSRVLEPAGRLVKFLSYFAHPDGTIGGEYGSRNTIYFMPNGLETFVHLGLDENMCVRGMLQTVYLESRESSYGDFMNSVDERYLTHYVMHSYFRAAQKFKERDVVEIRLPFNSLHVKIFYDAGLVTTYNGVYYAIVSMNKGGLIKIFKGKQELYWNGGYRIVLEEGTVATTNWLDKEYLITYADNVMEVKGEFNCVTPKVQNPIYHLGLRISALIIGSKVNRLVKKLTIFQNKHFDASFERKITMEGDKVIVEDIIDNPKEKLIEDASNISLRLVASGKFFSRSDLLEMELLKYGTGKKIVIRKVYDVRAETISTNISEG